MAEHIDLLNAIRQATQAMETATHHIAVLEAEIERLRLERAQLRRALHEVTYCLSAMEIQPSAMTKTTADTIVQLNLGGFND